MLYSELVQGIPLIFKHYVANVPALHTVLVFISIKSLPISKVPEKDWFHFRRVEPKELNVFHYVVRYVLGSKTLGTNVLEFQFVLCLQTMIKT